MHGLQAIPVELLTTVVLPEPPASDGSMLNLAGECALIALAAASLAGACWMLLRRQQAREPDPGHDRVLDQPGAIFQQTDTPEFLLARYDKQGELSFLSPIVTKTLGISPSEFVAGRRRIEEFVHPSDRPLLAKAEENRRRGKGTDMHYQYRLQRSDGSWHWMHARQIPITNHAGDIVAYESLSIDFTDRVDFERQQRRLLSLQKLSSSALEGLLNSEDLPAGFQPTLQLVGEHFPISRSSVLAIDYEELKAIEIFNEPAVQSPQGDPAVPLEGEIAAWWIRRIAGGVPVTISPRTLRDTEPRIRDAFKSNTASSMLILPLMINGMVKYAMIFHEAADREWLAEELAVLQTIAQAASRRLEQLEASQERDAFAELRRNLERAESISHLTSGIVHDFNNLIFAVSGRVSLLLRRAKDEFFREGLEEIMASINEAGNVVSRLLRVEQFEEDEQVRINPWQETSQICGTAERLLPRRTNLEVDIHHAEAAEHAFLMANPQTIQQLVLNLLVNARDATGPDGHIRLTAGGIDDNARFEIRIEDDGPGIPAEQYEDMMKPFVSTKPSGKGTGLGLSICRRVTEEAGGTLVLSQSELGGLCATATFPMVSGAPEAPAEQLPSQNHQLPYSILVVEDNEVIQDVLIRVLEVSGATVTARSDALEVERIMDEATTPFDLLIFDIDLPARTGVECLRDLRQAGCMTPCLLITGGTTEPPQFKRLCFLRKPFRIDTLLKCCSDLLNGKEPTP